MTTRLGRTTIVAVLALILGGVASAQSMKIGILDNDRLREGYTELRQALATLEAKVNAKKQELKSDQAALEVKLREFETQMQLSSDKESLRSRQKELLDQRAELREKLSDANDELYKEQEKVLKPFVAKIQEAVEKVAKAQKLDVVLKRDDVAYFNPAVDITSQVVLELTRKTGGAGQ